MDTEVYADTSVNNATSATAENVTDTPALYDEDFACLQDFSSLSEELVMFVTRKLVKNANVESFVSSLNGTDISYGHEGLEQLHCTLDAMLLSKFPQYCVMPMCDNEHWTLFAFIVSNRVVRVVHFDSDRPHGHHRSRVSMVMTALKPYEAVLHPDAVSATPRQINWYESGLYVLSAVGIFIQLVGANPASPENGVLKSFLAVMTTLKPLARSDVLDMLYDHQDVANLLYGMDIEPVQVATATVSME